MDVGRQDALEAEFPYHAPECCPECGTEVDLRTALLGDERDPLRRVGCTECGLWLVRNDRTRTRWLPLLAWGVVLVGVMVVAVPLLHELLAPPWAWLVQGLLVVAMVLVVPKRLEARYIRRIGPPWVPADGERADPG